MAKSVYVRMAWCTCARCTEKSPDGLYIPATQERSHALRYSAARKQQKLKKAGGQRLERKGAGKSPSTAAPAAEVATAETTAANEIAAVVSAAITSAATVDGDEVGAGRDWRDLIPPNLSAVALLPSTDIPGDYMDVDAGFELYDDDGVREGFELYDEDGSDQPLPSSSPTDTDTSSDPESIEVLELLPSELERIQEPHRSPSPPAILYSPEDQTTEIFESLGSLLWRGILFFAAFLNLRFHLSHRGCNLFLSFCRILLVYCSVLQREDKPELTLKTTFRTLGLQDRFEIRPMCGTCRRIYPAESDPDTKCLDCDEPLFKTKERLAKNFDGSVENEEEQTAVPELKFPYRSLTSQLEELLSRSGMEDALDSWRYIRRRPGRLCDIMSGMVWKTIKGSDGRLFFDNSPNHDSPDELRLGITLGFDGFGGERSTKGSTHSSGVLSHCIANLPIHLKYQPRNLLLSGIIPGPTEATGDELQRVLKLVVDEKLRLYNDGVLIKTPRFPEGRIVRVVCLATCCDHPALCRVNGFADHAHKVSFCSRCKAKRTCLREEGGLTDSFTPRTSEEHRRLSEQYKTCPEGQRQAFFKSNGARYFELSRLPYFDAIGMGIIDPMHNILLGICKTQWLDSWILGNVLRKQTPKKKRELDKIHYYLQKFEMPSWVGRLPRNVGYPAGGSLSADEYKALFLVYAPLVIPLIWMEFQPAAEADYEKKKAVYERNETARLARLASGNATEKDKESLKKPTVRMHRDDGNNFLKLASSLKILLARSINGDDIPRAKTLLGEYLKKYFEIYSSNVKPNHHWVCHIFDQIRDYGPVYGFWTFTNERLNKVLKSFPTNNHNGGEIETSFFRAFFKEAKLREKLYSSQSNGEPFLKEISALILQADDDLRGTVAAMAAMSDDVAAISYDCGKKFALGPGVCRRLDKELETPLVDYYRETALEASIVSSSSELTEHSNVLYPYAKFHSFIVIEGRRIVPSKSAQKASNAIIQTELQGTLFVGQVLGIFSHRQNPSLEPRILLQVHWFRALDDIDTKPWDPYPELEVKFWAYNDYLRHGEEGPSRVIPPSLVKSQACRLAIHFPRTQSTSEDPGDDDDNVYVETEQLPTVEPREQDESRTTLVWATIGLSRDDVVI